MYDVLCYTTWSILYTMRYPKMLVEGLDETGKTAKSLVAGRLNQEAETAPRPAMHSIV